jgi:glycosyltransferase involved in cell wall biosynthesis
MMYPGTLNWHQGLDMAIRAFAKIKELDSHIDFHIYGDGPAKPFLEELIQDLGLQDRVLLKDPLPIREIAEKMSSAGIGIVPKRNDPFSGDAFSTKTLEFMYLGVPIIISETKIDKYYFNDSVVRFFIPENVDALASAMLEMIKKKERRKELSENALKFVEDFSWEKKKQEYLNLVDCLNNGC